MQNTIHTKLKQTENNIFFNLTNGLATLTEYILNNPGKAIVLGLAGQAIGSSALGKPQNQSSVGNNSLIQGFTNKPYLSDNLSVIEQRVAPALNLTWLNQTDATQMKSITDWLGTNDTQVDERSHRTKREDRETEVKNYLLNHYVCLRNVQQNYEYLYASNGYESGNWKGGNRWKAFTWVPGDKVKEAKWDFTTSDNGRTFRIYNTHHQRYLHDTDNVWDDWSFGRHEVKTGTWLTEGSRYKWQVEVLSSASGMHIALWNDRSGRTLYASDDKQGDNRRYVFTWKKGEPLRKARWSVEYCGSNRRRREIPDKLEDITSPEEKDSQSFSDKAPTQFAFFQIKQPDQSNMTLEATSNPDFNKSLALKCQ